MKKFMKKFVMVLAILVVSQAARATDCISIADDNAGFQRVSSTEIIATDQFNQKYQVTVQDCPELMFDSPIVLSSFDDELCTSDMLTVGGDTCSITNIQPISN